MDRHILRATTKMKTQGDTLFSKRRILNWFGILSTLLIGGAAIAPDAFGISLDLRPWVFLTSIFLFMVVCAGIFNP